jgi:hypothetical protein
MAARSLIARLESTRYGRTHDRFSAGDNTELTALGAGTKSSLPDLSFLERKFGSCLRLPLERVC